MAGSSMDILKNKGLKGFYIGYMPTLIRDIVFSAIQLPLFEIIREKKVISNNEVVNSALSGSIAAIVAGFVSCPLDVIKTRLMTQDMKGNSVASILKIYEESGFKGYFKGCGFRCGILAFGGVVYFGALQKARTFLNLE
jgi:solute carrier family 25 S-adenosylmethionine transporter 26